MNQRKKTYLFFKPRPRTRRHALIDKLYELSRKLVVRPGPSLLVEATCGSAEFAEWELYSEDELTLKENYSGMVAVGLHRALENLELWVNRDGTVTIRTEEDLGPSVAVTFSISDAILNDGYEFEYQVQCIADLEQLAKRARHTIKTRVLRAMRSWKPQKDWAPAPFAAKFAQAPSEDEAHDIWREASMAHKAAPIVETGE